MKLIIPSINRPTFEKASLDIEKAQNFLPPDGWLHIDVSDGKFSTWSSWGNPEELKALNLKLNIEVHLMVEDPEAVVLSWLEAGARKIVVPAQKVRDWEELKSWCFEYRAELVPSFDPTVEIEKYGDLIRGFSCVQVLSVMPGRSGQSFDDVTIERIKFLKGVSPGVKIEVDGGINPQTGAKALAVGADVLVSGSYIFESDDPDEAFTSLKKLL